MPSGSATRIPVTRSPGVGERRRDACDSLEVVAQRHGLIVDSVP